MRNQVVGNRIRWKDLLHHCMHFEIVYYFWKILLPNWFSDKTIHWISLFKRNTIRIVPCSLNWLFGLLWIKIGTYWPHKSTNKVRPLSSDSKHEEIGCCNIDTWHTWHPCGRKGYKGPQNTLNLDLPCGYSIRIFWKMDAKSKWHN